MTMTDPEGGTPETDAPPTARRDAALEAAARVGIGAQEFAREERLLAEQSGGAASPGDVLWALTTRAIERYTRARDWDGAGLVYLAQARWLHEHEPGTDHQESLRLAHNAAVLDIQKRRHHARVAVDSKRCCPACAAIDGEEYSFARALEESPIPNPACELSWCKCTWRGIPIERRRR
jgi:hypothetical protein